MPESLDACAGLKLDPEHGVDEGGDCMVLFCMQVTAAALQIIPLRLNMNLKGRTLDELQVCLSPSNRLCAVSSVQDFRERVHYLRGHFERAV